LPDSGGIRISQSELENYLWGAAVLLRGLIDAGDYKGYIFPLIFLKRLSDVWDEEDDKALAIYGNDGKLAALPENHRFVIPQDAHWNDIRATTNNVGAKILSSMRQIEAANPLALSGVFGDADWTNKDLISDATLIDLLEHLSSKCLSIARLPEDELGNGYEFLVKKFADDSGHTAQEFYTNRTLVHLMTRILNPKPGESIYDPTCGTGGMLISCVSELKNQQKEFRSLKLYGQEMNYTTAAIAKMNLFLHGIEDGFIAHGDTLASPEFLTSSGTLRTFNVVLANPPYSIKTLDRNKFSSDPFGRNIWGVPPQGRADYAFFQHIAASLDSENGRAAILFPHGVLFRQEEKDMRKELVNSGILECVIGLAPGLFYNAPMEAVVIVLNMNNRDPNSVFFINAINLISKDRTKTFISEVDQNTITTAYHSQINEGDFCKSVPISDIASKDYSLSIPLYLESNYLTTAQEVPKFGSAFSSWMGESKENLDELRIILGLLEERS
jgi:type I restriction system adenine methylase HsdM